MDNIICIVIRKVSQSISINGTTIISNSLNAWDSDILVLYYADKKIIIIHYDTY